MKYSHYTPNAKVIVVSGAPDNVADKIVQMASTYEKSGMRVGILATVQTYRVTVLALLLILATGPPLKPLPSTCSRPAEFDRLKIDIVLANR